ncbi:hypothetical protein [Oceanobacter sp. 3_MG-2023]|uniref:hypothetical protein n=1 Tax=Oceanobacter sp. 3_MG-2023 TaxID=3062622 RepID=UPI00273672DF|nr:hypothetical protein [Oceanobacter sp. 3_MG-2023]MDP2505400.1 hypothetical protein [Oceanobacter sp. 3_MG-2023]
MITSMYSARTAILQAYSINQQSSGFVECGSRPAVSSTHRIASQYEAGKIIAAVEDQPEPMKDWLLWCYGPPTMAVMRSIQEGAIAALVDALNTAGFDVAQEMGKHRHAVAVRAQLLLYVHMDNYRALALSGHKKYRKPAHLDKAVRRLSGGEIGLDLRNYHRDFGVLPGNVDSACGWLDSVTLPTVADALRSVRQFRGAA